MKSALSTGFLLHASLSLACDEGVVDSPDPDESEVCSAHDPSWEIDNLEDGDARVAAQGGRNGNWWVFTDGTKDGGITPAANAAARPVEIPGGRCGSRRGMRIHGQGFTTWGATLSAGLRYTTEAAAIDVRNVRGVSFWARVGPDHTGSVRVQFQDSNSQPAGGQCDIEDSGSEACHDTFGVTLTGLSTLWREYTIDFGALSQRGFGYAAGRLDTTELYAVEWELQPNTKFDLWVDDLWFFE